MKAGAGLSSRMLHTLLSVPAALLLLSTAGAFAQGADATITLERSTNALSGWEAVPLSHGNLAAEGSVSVAGMSSNAFYRLKIAFNATNQANSAMVFVQGGTLPSSSPLGAASVFSFRIGRCEVTYGEWEAVKASSSDNGYDLGGVGRGSGVNFPVHSVSWEDAVKWCNAKSEMEGLSPVYYRNGAVFRSGASDRWGNDVVISTFANGYRLPTEAEWEWAARGGVASAGYTYSGSNILNDVGWYNANPGGGTKTIGSKAPNELGLRDMSGNVAEWCWDSYGAYASLRRFLGGSWDSGADDCAVVARSGYYSDQRLGHVGFRIVRSAAN